MGAEMFGQSAIGAGMGALNSGKSSVPGSMPPAPTPPQSTTDPYSMAVARAKAEYPRFAKYPIKITTGTGPFQSETYEPEDDQNPSPGNWTIQLRSKQALAADPAQYVGLEMIHALQATDPTYQAMTDQFVKSMTPDQLEDARKRYKTEQKEYGEKRPFDKWLNHVQAQEYIRGGIFTKAIPNWIGPNGEGRYTPKQMGLLNQIRQYLQTPAASQSGRNGLMGTEMFGQSASNPMSQQMLGGLQGGAGAKTGGSGGMMGGAAEGAMSGAAMGSAAGPYGMLAGGLIGAGLGALSSGKGGSSSGQMPPQAQPPQMRPPTPPAQGAGMPSPAPPPPSPAVAASNYMVPPQGGNQMQQAQQNPQMAQQMQLMKALGLG